MGPVKDYVYKYKCAICNKLFKNVSNLVVHVKGHDGKKIYKCKFCDKLFISTAQFNKHLMKHSNQGKRYSCNVCLKKFCTFVKLKHHTKRHGTPYFCNTCHQNFDASFQLRRHLCSRGTESKRLYNKQVSHLVHDEVDLHNDDVSDAASPGNVVTGVLDSDVDDVMEDSDSRATNLNEFYGSEIEVDHSYSFPVQINKEEKDFNEFQTLDLVNVRSMAGEVLAEESNEAMHAQLNDISVIDDCVMDIEIKKENSEIQNFASDDELVVLSTKISHKCSECGKIFSLASKLRRHMQVHSDGKPYMCELCPKTFKHKDSLTKHCKHCNGSNSGDETINLCKICKKVFKSKLSLDDHHEMVHHNEENGDGLAKKKFICAFCAKECSTRLILKMHEKRHKQIPTPKKAPLSCNICGKVFFVQKYLTHHMKNHNSTENRHDCEECGKSFLNHYNLERHYITHTDTCPFICEVCGKAFKSKKYLYDHKLATHSTERFPCDICKKVYKTKRILSKHTCGTSEGPSGRAPRNRSRIRPFKCDICSKRFKLEKNFLLHKETPEHCERPLPVVCPICGKTFNGTKNIKAHMRIHTTGGNQFSCEECGKSFLSMDRLKRHSTIHSDTRPFVCHVCGKGFKDVSSLGKHIKIHSADRQIYACEFCNREFASRSGLNIHVMDHTGVRPFVCSFCPMAFKQHETLKEHERIHTGDKPYCCPHCPKRFGSKSAFNDHKFIHTDERPFDCDQCTLSFKKKNSLNRHVNKVHLLKFRIFLCEFCTKEFKRSRDLARHVAKYHNFGGEQTVDVTSSTVLVVKAEAIQ